MAAPLYVLYGPPAAGKSTTLIHLALNDPACVAIDLENYPDDAGRLAFLERLARAPVGNPMFVGAADLDPGKFPANCRLIALIDEDVDRYLARVAARETRFLEGGSMGAELHHRNMRIYLSHHRPVLQFDTGAYDGEFDRLAREILDAVAKLEEESGERPAARSSSEA